MIGVNYVTNDKGENTALLIDLAQLRQADTARSHLPEFPEDLDDVIVAGLSKGQQVRLYEYLRNEILPRH